MLKERRERRRSRYLDAAIGIVVRDGLDALTMQAIASEVGAAVGTIYGYFPSKSALLVELQMMAIERITVAWTGIEPRWRAEFEARGATPDEVAVGMAAMFGEFFLEIARVLPQEFRLQQLQLAQTHELFDPDEVDRLLPAAIGMFQVPYHLLVEATAAGMLDRAEAEAERSLAMVLALNGVTLSEHIQVLHDVLSVSDLVRMVLRALLVGWGAPREVVDTGARLAVDIVAAVPLPPPEVTAPDE